MTFTTGSSSRTFSRSRRVITAAAVSVLVIDAKRNSASADLAAPNGRTNSSLPRRTQRHAADTWASAVAFASTSTAASNFPRLAALRIGADKTVPSPATMNVRRFTGTSPTPPYAPFPGQETVGAARVQVSPFEYNPQAFFPEHFSRHRMGRSEHAVKHL